MPGSGGKELPWLFIVVLFDACFVRFLPKSAISSPKKMLRSKPLGSDAFVPATWGLLPKLQSFQPPCSKTPRHHPAPTNRHQAGFH